MRMLADGIVPMQIADNLSISVKTVSQHVNNIEKKLGVENRLYLQKMLIKIKKEANAYSTLQMLFGFPSECRGSATLNRQGAN